MCHSLSLSGRLVSSGRSWVLSDKVPLIAPGALDHHLISAKCPEKPTRASKWHSYYWNLIYIQSSVTEPSRGAAPFFHFFCRPHAGPFIISPSGHRKSIVL